MEANAYDEAFNEACSKAPIINAYSDAVAIHEARAEAKVKAWALITPLYNSAVDCLRSSMHFFHPIQQCAQQVYHTAVPLSPTSSQLYNSCLQMVTNNQLSCVTTFLGAPDTWGSLLRTIDIRPRQPTCIATSAQTIIAAYEGIVNIYNAVTFVLRQSLHPPETVTKIQDSPDGSTLFFAHSSSVSMWDVQTGGLIHTFSTQTEVMDIAVSMAEDHIACGLSDGSISFWNTHTKEEGKGFGDGEPVIAIYWLPHLELAVATQNSFRIHKVTVNRIPKIISTPGPVWGMIYLANWDEFLVGTSNPSKELQLELYTLKHGDYIQVHQPRWQFRRQMRSQQLMRPMQVDNNIVFMTHPSGVVSLSADLHKDDQANNPPLLDAATSMAISTSLGTDLVVQTKDSIQIFTPDVLASSDVRKDAHPSQVYPLGDEHIICVLRPSRHLTLLKLETLKKHCPPLSLWSSLSNRSPPIHVPFGRGLVAELGVSAVMRAWQSGTPLPEWTETAGRDMPLCGSSPKRTRMVTYDSPRRELRVDDAKGGVTLTNLSLDDDYFGTWEVYDLTFDSETRFNLKMDGPGRHVQIPYDIIISPLRPHPYIITQGEPIPLPEPRETPPYTLDANCEWVLDVKSRKVCWVSPGNVRRGDGGHFWAGRLSLVMVGDDGVVRKLTFREPDC